jgi:hypothetical protein
VDGTECLARFRHHGEEDDGDSQPGDADGMGISRASIQNKLRDYSSAERLRLAVGRAVRLTEHVRSDGAELG